MQKQEEEGGNRVFRRDRITLGFDLWFIQKERLRNREFKAKLKEHLGVNGFGLLIARMGKSECEVSYFGVR